MTVIAIAIIVYQNFGSHALKELVDKLLEKPKHGRLWDDAIL